MKRHGKLFEEIVSWPNLVAAAKKARRGKRNRHDIQRFDFDLERNLVHLQHELTCRCYIPGDFNSFEIWEPKNRVISAAPYRDRVVHHAVCSVIEPIFDRSFVYESFACRKDKGTHAAVETAKRYAKTHRYALQCDVKKFFPNIDHDILLQLLEKKLKDQDAIDLLRKIIQKPFPKQGSPEFFAGDDLFSHSIRNCGLPIGNQTSQLFGNIMLNPLDHFVKRSLRFRAYVRYADDFVLFHNSSTELLRARDSIQDFLAELRLRLNAKKSVVFAVKTGLRFLGFRIFPDHIRLDKSNVKNSGDGWRLLKENSCKVKSQAMTFGDPLSDGGAMRNMQIAHDLLGTSCGNSRSTRRSNPPIPTRPINNRIAK